MLHRLIEQSGASEPGFASKHILYALDLGDQNRIVPIDERFDRCPHLVHSEMLSGSAGRSQFLVETLATVLLLDPKKRKRHQFYLQLLHSAGPELKACAQALESDLPRLQKLALAHRLRPTGPTSLLWKGRNLLAEDFWHDWWRNFRAQLHPPRKAPWMRDLLTGELCQPVETHPRSGGLSSVGGMTVGDSLVSFDPPAFESYGLSRAQNAAMSEHSARRLADSLIQLCTSQLYFAGSKIAYWYSHPQPDDPLGYLLEPERADFDPREKSTGYYRIAILSGAHGRVMIRHWEEGPIQTLRTHVAQWYESTRIVPLEGDLSLPQVLESLYPAERIPDNLAAPLLRAALHGRPVPHLCLQRAVQRSHSDLLLKRALPRARMGLIKASLQAPNLRVHQRHKDRSYQAGRLMALLQQTTPRPLGRCWLCPRTALQPHLDQLDTTLQRLENYYEKDWFRWQLASFGDLPAAPLSLHQQANLLLGYYQQMAHHPGREYEENAD